MDTNKFDEESTVYDNTTVNTQNTAPTPTTDKKSHTWRKVVIGGAAGIALGSAASYFSATKAANTENNDEVEDAESAEGTADGNGNPLVDDSVDIADGVTEDMSFSQAFAAARAEVGPGGVFEWHGGIYSTYTAEEWDSMSADERDAYNDNFAWNHGGSHGSGTHSEDNSIAQENTTQSQTEHANGDDVPVEDVVIPNNNDEISEGEVGHEPEVQVLGVVHDAESGMNYGGLVVDGQQVVLIDVNDDHTFDVIASDLNGDGQLSENEMAVLEQPVTTDDLGGFSSGAGGDLYAEDDGPDYVNDDAGANDFIS